MTETPGDILARGRKEGRIDALLAEHSSHLAKINGSIDRFSESSEDLTVAMRELASEIRTLQEEGRSAALAVKVAADTLAIETERRRDELATSVATTSGTWSLRSNKATVIYVFVGLIAVLASIYFGTRSHPPTVGPAVTTLSP